MEKVGCESRGLMETRAFSFNNGSNNAGAQLVSLRLYRGSSQAGAGADSSSCLHMDTGKVRSRRHSGYFRNQNDGFCPINPLKRPTSMILSPKRRILPETEFNTILVPK
jgi:hypothetical protein